MRGRRRKDTPVTSCWGNDTLFDARTPSENTSYQICGGTDGEVFPADQWDGSDYLGPIPRRRFPYPRPFQDHIRRTHRSLRYNAPSPEARILAIDANQVGKLSESKQAIFLMQANISVTSRWSFNFCITVSTLEYHATLLDMFALRPRQLPLLRQFLPICLMILNRSDCS